MESITAKLLSYHTKDRNYSIFSSIIYLLFFGAIIWFICLSGKGDKIFTKVLTGNPNGVLPPMITYIAYIYALFIPLYLGYKIYVFASRKSKIFNVLNMANLVSNAK